MFFTSIIFYFKVLSCMIKLCGDICFNRNIFNRWNFSVPSLDNNFLTSKLWRSSHNGRPLLSNLFLLKFKLFFVFFQNFFFSFFFNFFVILLNNLFILWVFLANTFDIAKSGLCPLINIFCCLHLTYVVRHFNLSLSHYCL